MEEALLGRPCHLGWGEPVVPTTVYLPQDSMALTLNGTTRWPSAKILQRLGETRAACTPARVRQIFERIADAIADTRPEVRGYIRQHPSFKGIGNGMLREWEQGVKGSIAAAVR